MSKEHVLVVDDDSSIRDVLGALFSQSEDFDVTTVEDGPAAFRAARDEEFAVAIVDLVMPGMDGIEVIRELKRMQPAMEAIIFTGMPSLDSSLDAVHEHVFDYVVKPCDLKELTAKVRRAAERRRLVLANEELVRRLQVEQHRLEKEVSAAKRVIEKQLEESRTFVGQSSAAIEIRQQVAEVAPSGINVLLLGASGAGKDVIAHMIHESSGREVKAFVKVNCPAIPETLMESELFGHEAGAFTGAVRRKPGRFELASGGTLFLDEIGELSYAMQSKLLEAVEQKKFFTVGGQRPIHVDVRIVAATNAPILKMIDDGTFRPDLYYRLSEYSMEVPTLQERKDDIPLLVEHFLSRYRPQFGCPNRSVSDEVMALLVDYDWPGNTRELQSVVRRYALTGLEEDVLKAVGYTGPRPLRGAVPVTVGPARPGGDGDGPDAERIVRTLARTRWNRRKACVELGMSYSTLRRRIAEYGLAEE